MKKHMGWLHLNVVGTTRKYPLMYSLPIRHCGMILKSTLTTFTKVVDWGKAKRHIIIEGVYVNFLKQNFE
jgi:hypothetical protein